MKNKLRCEIIIYWSDVDQGYIAEVPALPGCAADGKTYKQATRKCRSDKFMSGSKQPRTLSDLTLNPKGGSYTHKPTPTPAA